MSKFFNSLVLMPTAKKEYSYEFPSDVRRIRMFLRDAAKVAHVSVVPDSVAGDFLVTASGLAIGTTKPNVANDACTVVIAGISASVSAVAAGTALAGSNVPINLYGAWRLQVSDDDTIDIVEAADNATGYATPEAAIAGLPALADNHTSLGTVTAMNTGGVFNPGTTDLDTGTVTEAYADGTLVTIESRGYLTIAAAGEVDEKDLYPLKTRTFYFSSPDATQYMEIMYWTGLKRES